MTFRTKKKLLKNMIKARWQFIISSLFGTVKSDATFLHNEVIRIQQSRKLNEGPILEPTQHLLAPRELLSHLVNFDHP